MIRMRTAIVAIALMLATSTLSSVAAAPPQVSEDKDKIVLENDHVRVWFQGKKPMLKVFPADAPDAEDANGSYGYQFRELVEYNDLDGDGLPSTNEVLASLDLNRANAWNVTREEGEGNVTLTLSLVAPVKLGRSAGLPTDDVTTNATENLTLPGRGTSANVSIVFRIFETETTLTSDNLTVVVPETAIKYDLLVHSWPFVNAQVGRLALELQVTGELEIDGDNATVLSNGSTVGALSWVATASGNTTEGQAVEVPVRAGVAATGENMSRLVFTYDAPMLASLVHDPTVGTAGGASSDGVDGTSGGADRGESRSNVPAPGLVALAGVAAAAALAARRQRP